MWYASLCPITKCCLIYGLAFWICAYMSWKQFTRVFFLFSGKIFRDKWKWGCLRGAKSKILHVKFTYGCKAVINKILFEEFFYYLQHTEKLIKSLVSSEVNEGLIVTISVATYAVFLLKFVCWLNWHVYTKSNKNFSSMLLLV